ncbi:MAG: outer membrane beta-barrel protein [Marinobacter sp.]|nr:outer membrane beta-barrel protein [Marinobacter sp.]
MKSKLAAASIATLMTLNAHAEAPKDVQGYVGANYVFLTYEEDGISEDFDLGALVAKAGAKFNPYLSAEFRAGLGVDDHSESGGGFTAELELDYLVGGYAIAGIPNETPIYPYAVLGVTKGKLTASVSGFGESASVSESESDISFGIGANFAVNDEVNLNAEYMNYLDKDGAEITGVSVGLVVLF